MLPSPIKSSSVLPWEEGLSIVPSDASLPEVSIVIPIYNSAAFLEKTIRSLLCNDLTGIELIVMDGGSKDGTQEILDHYRSYFSVCVTEPDKGQSDAINKGFLRATKPILYWLNGDDIILPNTLERVRQAFKDSPGTEVVVGDAYMTEKDFTPIHHFQFSPEKLKFSYLLDYAAHHLIQPSVFFTRTAWDACGPVAEDMHYAMDADLFLNMASIFEFIHIPVDIAYSVYHEECKTRGKRGESITELSLVQAKYGGTTEARKTLNILVQMFNDAESKIAQMEGATQAAEPATSGCSKCKVYSEKLKAVQLEVKANQNMLLQLDMELTS